MICEDVYTDGRYSGVVQISKDGQYLKEKIILNEAIGPKLKIKKFEMEHDGSSIEEAIERLDNVFTDSMYQLKERFPSDTVYGLGLSGGLDSRIVLHYAKKVDLNLRCFIGGDPHPHYLLASRDYKNALLIGKKYGLEKKDITVIKPNNNYLENFMEDCTKYPEKNINPSVVAGTYCNKFKEMDVMISGHMGGESVGSCIPEKNPENIATYVFERISALVSRWGGEIKTSIDGILTEQEFNEMHAKLDDCFRKFDGDYTTALTSYLYSQIIEKCYGKPGLIIKHNTFNPIFCLFYTEEYVAEMKTWNPEWIRTHIMQKEMHRQLIPKLCDITNQRWMVPYNKQDSKMALIYKNWYMGMFVMRWFGLRYHEWCYSLMRTKFAKEVLCKKNNEFDIIFESDAVLKLPKKMSILACDILKIKYLMDVKNGH